MRVYLNEISVNGDQTNNYFSRWTNVFWKGILGVNKFSLDGVNFFKKGLSAVLLSSTVDMGALKL